MTAQDLANDLLQLLPKLSIPMAPENLKRAAMIYQTLGKMAKGELILSESAAPEPPKD